MKWCGLTTFSVVGPHRSKFPLAMNTNSPSLRPSILLAFVALAVLGRVATPVLPHAFNFAPMDAIALFAGAYFRPRHLAVLVPLLGIWVSDVLLSPSYFGHVQFFYSGFYWQYGTYALLALLAHTGLRRVSVPGVAVAGVSAAALFFLISNFGVWASGTMYPHTASGLLACYAAGLPFFPQSLLSDLVYCTVLFGGFELVQRRFPVLARPVLA